MGITGDHYTAEHNGHTIELVRDNLVKRLTLIIDGQEIASESVALPHDITITGTFEIDGAEHTVLAKSHVKFPSTVVTIEVDGSEVALEKTK